MLLLHAILQGLCPRCRQITIFSSWLKMNRACSSCGLVFDREPGYFLGAMMVSYGIAVAAYALLYFGLGWMTSLGIQARIVVMILLFLPFVPAVFRYSRIIWIYFDQAIDPQRNE